MNTLNKDLTIDSIWGKYNPILKNFILRRVNSEFETDDILQEVFIKVHFKIPTLQNSEKLAAWIFQITRNVIIDNYKRKKHLDEIKENTIVKDFNTETDPYELLSKSMKFMIAKLPEKYREAIIYTHCYGLSQKELSEILNVSFSTARSRVQRARKKLKELYLECCHFELDRYGNILDYYPYCPCRNYNNASF